MPSLSFILGARHRPKPSKSRPEIRRVTEQQENPIQSRVSYEVLDIHEKATTSDPGQVHTLPSEGVDATTLHNQGALSRDAPPPWPTSNPTASTVPVEPTPRIEVDLPENTAGGLNSWFPPYFHRRGSNSIASASSSAAVTRDEPSASASSSTPHVPPSAWRRPTPSPIQIPTPTSNSTTPATLHSSSQSQLSRRGSAISALDSSRPASASSLDNVSTISGTTLARALIGSTFLFPSENRSSKYRSGMTSLTRADSTTLPPPTDDGFSTSHWRDRRTSGASIVRTPDPHGDIPPVPTIPEALKSSVTSINSSGQMADGPFIANSNGGDAFPYSLPETPNLDSFCPSVIGGHVPSNGDLGLPATPLSSSRPSSEPHTSLPGVDDVLDYYQFISSTDLERNTRPLFSPIQEVSPSAEVPPGLFSENDEPEAQPSSASSARFKGATNQRSISSRKRLPIGSPSRPSPSHRLSDSNKVLITGTRPEPNRGRSGSAPSPIIVVRDPRDQNRYSIMVESMNESSEVHSLPYGCVDTGPGASRQTFPETPNVLSPIWSPSATVPEGSLVEGSRTTLPRHPSIGRFSTPQPPPKRGTEKDIHRAASFSVSHSQQESFGASSFGARDDNNRSLPTNQAENQTSAALAPELPSQPSSSGFLQPSSNAASPGSSAEVTLPRSSPTPSEDTRFTSPRALHLRSDSESSAGTRSNHARPGIMNAPPSYSTIIDPAAYEDYKAHMTAGTSHRQEASDAADASSHGSERRSRTRPPLPLGPRKQTGAIGAARGRNSVALSASSSAPQSASSRRRSALIQMPRFNAPPPLFKGLTMDHAKWSFTSSELQAIVSEAIRKSSQTSTIRLLPLQTLQRELPEELARLEAQRDDFKTRYKLLSRKRTTLIATLTTQLESGGGSTPNGAAARALEELNYISTQMDQIAEELYTVTEQIGQTKALRETHSYSALAMALRKLNTSFARQVDANQSLNLEVEILKQERDIAWAQAERYAHDYDLLLDKSQPEVGVQSVSSRRSSRVTTQRRSVARIQAAINTSSVVRSRCSSTTSSHGRPSMSFNPTSRPVFTPPVPPIPITHPTPPSNVDYRRRESTQTFESPITGDSAMILAQQELYEMLGITDWHPLRRRQSYTGEQGDSLNRQGVIDVPPRPNSLPDHSKETSDTNVLKTLTYLNAE